MAWYVLLDNRMTINVLVYQQLTNFIAKIFWLYFSDRFRSTLAILFALIVVNRGKSLDWLSKFRTLYYQKYEEVVHTNLSLLKHTEDKLIIEIKSRTIYSKHIMYLLVIAANEVTSRIGKIKNFW